MKLLDLFRRRSSNNIRFKKVYIIINPAAGQKKKERLIKIIDNFFKESGIQYQCYFTKQSGDATFQARAAVKEGYDLIIAAGGDGTINEVVNGIIGSNVTLGIIPLGTVNILAMELGIDESFVKALSVIHNGEIIEIDVGKLNSQYFLLMVGAGFDSYAIYRVNLKLKRYIGAFAYVFSGIYSIFKYKPKKIIVNIDDHRIDEVGYFVVVENVDAYGGKFKIAPYASFNDKLLDVCVFKKYSLWDTFRYFLGVALTRHLSYPDVRYYQCKKVELTSDENVLVHSDGDLVCSLPARIEIAREEIKVLRPKV